MAERPETTEAPPLAWHPCRGGFCAPCGEEGQGEARVGMLADNTFAWWVDMLPYDSEPVVGGRAGSFAEGRTLAERQAAAWPALIEGASR